MVRSIEIMTEAAVVVAPGPSINTWEDIIQRMYEYYLSNYNNTNSSNQHSTFDLQNTGVVFK